MLFKEFQHTPVGFPFIPESLRDRIEILKGVAPHFAAAVSLIVRTPENCMPGPGLVFFAGVLEKELFVVFGGFGPVVSVEMQVDRIADDEHIWV